MEEDDVNERAGRLVKEVGEKIKTLDDLTEESSLLLETFDIDFIISASATINEDEHGKRQRYFKYISSQDDQHVWETAKAVVESIREGAVLRMLREYITVRIDNATGQAEGD